MVQWHKQFTKKFTGGKLHRNRDKRKKERGSAPSLTKLAEEDLVRQLRCMSAIKKQRAIRLSTANVLNPGTGKVVKAKIKKVVENGASRHFARMAVITKGAILETDAGKAKVMNRPGQEGTINAVLIK